MKRHQTRRALATICSSIALCTACTRGKVDLGGGAAPQDPDVSEESRCPELAIDETLEVRNQSDLDALAGCAEITGALQILTFENADLSPLTSLRVIRGGLSIVAPAEPVPGENEFTASEAYQANQLGGAFESLHGFESLESVGRHLFLTRISAEDLTGFAGLRRDIEWLYIEDANNLRDLSGLEGTRIEELSIFDCNALQSLHGVNFHIEVGSVQLIDLPALKDASALAAIRNMRELTLLWTGMEALPQMNELVVEHLVVNMNDQLIDANGLDMVDARSMQFSNNARLRALPILSNIATLDALVVYNNGLIEEVSLNFPRLSSAFPSPLFASDSWQTPPSSALIDIGGNPALKRITSPASLDSIQYFNVYSNPSLTDLDLGTLARVDFLTIDSNPALETVTIPSLASVDSLTITSNPAFAPTVFDTVPTFTRTISGNASAP